MNKNLKVNLGAGGERIRGWKSLDLPVDAPGRKVVDLTIACRCFARKTC